MNILESGGTKWKAVFLFRMKIPQMQETFMIMAKISCVHMNVAVCIWYSCWFHFSISVSLSYCNVVLCSNEEFGQTILYVGFPRNVSNSVGVTSISWFCNVVGTTCATIATLHWVRSNPAGRFMYTFSFRMQLVCFDVIWLVCEIWGTDTWVVFLITILLQLFLSHCERLVT